MTTGTADAMVIDTNRLIYTVEEVAYLLNLSRGIAYQHVRDGVIPAERVGRRWLIPRKRFHAWLDGRAAA
jgi:excisionase family DNA binding protein